MAASYSPGQYSGAYPPPPETVGQDARGYNEELPSDAEVVPLGRSRVGGQTSGRCGRGGRLGARMAPGGASSDPSLKQLLCR